MDTVAKTPLLPDIANSQHNLFLLNNTTMAATDPRAYKQLPAGDFDSETDFEQEKTARGSSPNHQALWAMVVCFIIISTNIITWFYFSHILSTPGVKQQSCKPALVN